MSLVGLLTVQRIEVAVNSLPLDHCLVPGFAAYVDRSQALHLAEKLLVIVYGHERLLNFCLAVLYLGKRTRDSLILVGYVLLDLHLLVCPHLHVLFLEVGQLLYCPVSNNSILWGLVPSTDTVGYLFVHIALYGLANHHSCRISLTVRVNYTSVILRLANITIYWRVVATACHDVKVIERVRSIGFQTTRSVVSFRLVMRLEVTNIVWLAISVDVDLAHFEPFRSWVTALLIQLYTKLGRAYLVLIHLPEVRVAVRLPHMGLSWRVGTPVPLGPLTDGCRILVAGHRYFGITPAYHG